MFRHRGDSVGAITLFLEITFAFVFALIPAVRLDLVISEFLTEVLWWGLYVIR